MQLLGVSKRKVICFLNGALAGSYATSQQVQSTPCPGTNHDVTYCVKSEIRTAGAWVSYEMMKKWTRTTLFVNKKFIRYFSQLFPLQGSVLLILFGVNKKSHHNALEIFGKYFQTRTL
jgi:hypothetical protein